MKAKFFNFAYPICRIVLAVRPNNLNDAHLEQLIQRRNGIVDAKDILHGLEYGMREENECIPFASRVQFSDDECLHEF